MPAEIFLSLSVGISKYLEEHRPNTNLASPLHRTLSKSLKLFTSWREKILSLKINIKLFTSLEQDLIIILR